MEKAVDLNEVKADKEAAEGFAAEAARVSEEAFRTVSGQSQGGVEVLCPGTLHQKTGPSVTATQTNAIVMSPLGVFIVGTVNNKQADEKSIMCPWDNVAYIDYDTALLTKLVRDAAQAAAEEATEAAKEDIANGTD